MPYNMIVIQMSTNMTTTLSIRIDQDLKEEVEDLLADLGMNVTTAITCFFKKSLTLLGNAQAFYMGTNNDYSLNRKTDLVAKIFNKLK